MGILKQSPNLIMVKKVVSSADKAVAAAELKSNNGKFYKMRFQTKFVNDAPLKIGKTNHMNVRGILPPSHLTTATCLTGVVDSEKAMRKIENNNTLVFWCQRKSDKKLIRQAVEERYNVKVMKVNTLITPRLKKKAYVRLSPANDATAVAQKLGLV